MLTFCEETDFQPLFSVTVSLSYPLRQSKDKGVRSLVSKQLPITQPLLRMGSEATVQFDTLLL
jgi:hypothetical protein